ncbi:MAG: hypothetical protein QXW41_08955 [Fervidicoccaceae archaeon]
MSGYFDLLNDQQKEVATRDPKNWLASHPYLYSAYPQYFVERKKLIQPQLGEATQAVQTTIGLLGSFNPLVSPFTSILQLPQNTPFSQQVQQAAVSNAQAAGASLGEEFKSIGEGIVTTITGLARVPGEALKSLFEAGAAFERAPLGSLAVLGIILLIGLLLFVLR